MSIKRIAQESIDKADCGIASVAMVTNTTYSQAFDELKKCEKNGEFYTRHSDLMGAIDRLGFKASRKRFKGFRAIKGIAIVATNKTKERYWHWVVLYNSPTETFIYDPKPHKKGKITDFRGLNGTGDYIQVVVGGDTQ